MSVTSTVLEGDPGGVYVDATQCVEKIRTVSQLGYVEGRHSHGGVKITCVRNVLNGVRTQGVGISTGMQDNGKDDGQKHDRTMQAWW